MLLILFKLKSIQTIQDGRLVASSATSFGEAAEKLGGWLCRPQASDFSHQENSKFEGSTGYERTAGNRTTKLLNCHRIHN